MIALGVRRGVLWVEDPEPFAASPGASTCRALASTADFAEPPSALLPSPAALHPARARDAVSSTPASTLTGRTGRAVRAVRGVRMGVPPEDGDCVATAT